MLEKGVHANTIISGYRQAAKAGIAFLKRSLAVSSGGVTREVLISVAKTSMASKVLHTHDAFFAELCVGAALCVADASQSKCPVNHINIVKSLGRSLPESQLIAHGLALNARRAAEAMPSRLTGVKVAVLDLSISRTRLGMGIQFKLKDAAGLQAIQQEEVNQSKRIIAAILAAGASVIVTSKTIDELNCKTLIKAGAIGIRHVSDGEVEALARATGASLVRELIDEGGEFAFSPDWLGTAGVVEQVDIGDNEMVVFRDCGAERCASIVLRGPNTYALEEANRTLRDVLNAVKRVVESKHVVVGGGCVETGVSVALDRIALEIAGKEQAAYAAFAEAMLVIPKILAANAALDAIELVATLRAAHFAAQTAGQKCFMSLDLFQNGIQDGFAAGIIEPAMSKIKSIQFATEAAITILRIDDVIKVKPEKQLPEE